MIHSDSMHQITLYTAQQKPILEGDLRVFATQGLRNLTNRFPGLKIVRHAFYPNRVEMVLDFQRLDEDVLRVVQSFKSEVKTLAKKKGLADDSLWQWNYEDQWVIPPTS
jgi:hypothetical protein